MRNCRAAADWMLGLKPTDVALAAMPLFHVGGMWYHLFPAFVSGCTTILAPEFSPSNILTLLERHVRYLFAFRSDHDQRLGEPSRSQQDRSVKNANRLLCGLHYAGRTATQSHRYIPALRIHAGLWID